MNKYNIIRVDIVNISIELGNVEKNLASILEFGMSSKADILILQEDCLTGFGLQKDLKEFLKDKVETAISTLRRNLESRNRVLIFKQFDQIYNFDGKSLGYEISVDSQKSGNINIIYRKEPKLATKDSNLIFSVKCNNSVSFYISPSFCGSSGNLYDGTVIGIGNNTQNLPSTFKDHIKTYYVDADLYKLNKVFTSPIGFDNFEIPKLSSSPILDSTSNDLAISLQTLGLIGRWQAIGGPKLVLGISGGSDSTLALIVCCRAMDQLKEKRSNIIACSLPGLATSDRTKSNARKLCELLEVDFREIDITEMCKAEFKALNHSEEQQDIVYENVQARIRTSYLMNLANQEHGIVVGTGDMSEGALGWCTFGGDQLSMYNVNANVPKTLVLSILRDVSKSSYFPEEVQQIIADIVDTPISPELKDQQTTEDTTGPYELHDFFLYYFLKYHLSKEKIQYLAENVNWEYTKEQISKCLNFFMSRFFSQAFKRIASPEYPRIIDIDFWDMSGDVKLW